MKLKASAVLVVALVGASASAVDPKAANAAFIRAAKAAITADLRDPGSAQFRNLTVHKHKDGLMLCGELNAKNAMGGYSGFRPFISSTGAMVYMGEQMSALWTEYCGGSDDQGGASAVAPQKPAMDPITVEGVDPNILYPDLSKLKR